MKVGIVGAGVTGLTAAYDLLQAGCEVTIFEASETIGGLASGFRDTSWEWPLERFYHHVFASDQEIIKLATELGMSEDLFFRSPRTSILHDGEIYPFSNPVDWFRFPGYNLWDFFRFGVVGAFIRYTKFWRYLERETAVAWTRRTYGRKIFETSWKPLLIGKFGEAYDEVNMAWLWARLHARTFKLGYFRGGFQAFVDQLAARVRALGGEIRLQQPVQVIAPQAGGGLTLQTARGAERFDAVLATTSPRLLTRLAPALPDSYLHQLLQLRSMGAVVLTLALRRPFLPDGRTYWLNVPADSPQKEKNPLPFLALVEHTNYIDRVHYGGDHLVYCGDYLPPAHPYFQLPDDQLRELYLQALPQINPAFRLDWIRASWVHRAAYAQPIPLVNHAQNIPAITTPLSGLYFASMSQVYPWDRGTNFAVEIGRKAAAEMVGRINRR
jgi:protoporphyrinogen oxidase